MEQGPPLAGGKEEVGAKGQIDERAAKRTTNRVESRINLRAEGLEQAEQSRMGEQDGQDEQPGRGASTPEAGAAEAAAVLPTKIDSAILKLGLSRGMLASLFLLIMY